MGTQVYKAEEELPDCCCCDDCTTYCQRTARKFTINMYDIDQSSSSKLFNQTQALKFYRPKRWCGRWCCCLLGGPLNNLLNRYSSCCGHPCTPDKVTCTSSDGETIAHTKQQNSKGFLCSTDSESFSFNYMLHVTCISFYSM